MNLSSLKSKFLILKNSKFWFYGALLLFASSLLVLLGIHLEHKFKSSEYIPYYYGFYQQKNEIKKIQGFVKTSRKAITEWKAYHVAPTQFNIEKKAESLSGNAREQFSDLDFEVFPSLPNSWKIQARYFYAYSLLICTDIEESEDCLEKLGEQLTQLSALINGDLSKREEIWLEKIGIKTHANLLEAQFAAIHLKRDPKSEQKLKAAKKALVEYKSYNALLKEGINNDRILGYVFGTLQPSSSQVQTDYIIPE